MFDAFCSHASLCIIRIHRRYTLIHGNSLRLLLECFIDFTGSQEGGQ
jgi:hypothetical protein